MPTAAVALDHESLLRQMVQEQVCAIERALENGELPTARLHARELNSILDNGPISTAPSLRLVGGPPLTTRELAALRQLTDGSMSQKDIARALGVSRNTIKTHLKSLYLKLGVHCRGEAIHRAREYGLLPETLVVQAPIEVPASRLPLVEAVLS